MPGEGLARPVPTSPNLRRKPEEWGEAMTERFFHPLDDEITISAKDELVEAILEIDFERGAERRTSDLSGTVHAGGIPTNAGLSELSGVSIRHPEARDAGFCVETQWSGNGAGSDRDHESALPPWPRGDRSGGDMRSEPIQQYCSSRRWLGGQCRRAGVG